MNHQVIFKPTKVHVSEIESWLIDEDKKNGEGFYRNWDTIIESFNKGQVAVIIENNFSIGFLVYKINNLVTDIKIAEIKPENRNKGLGKILLNTCLDHFKEKGSCVVELYCAPKSSEPIWKSLGFQDFPNLYNEKKIRLYKTLIPTLEPNKEKKIARKLELWNVEDYMSKNLDPKWVWGIEFIEGTTKLKTPIIHPAHYKWKICYKKGNHIIKEEQIQRFNIAEIEHEDFIIVKELPNNE